MPGLYDVKCAHVTKQDNRLYVSGLHIWQSVSMWPRHTTGSICVQFIQCRMCLCNPAMHEAPYMSGL